MLRKLWFNLFPIKCTLNEGSEFTFTHPRGGDKNQICTVLKRYDFDKRTFLLISLEVPFWDEYTVSELKVEVVTFDYDGTIRLLTLDEHLLLMKLCGGNV